VSKNTNEDMELLGEIIDDHMPHYLAFCFGVTDEEPHLFNYLETLCKMNPDQAGQLLYGIDQIREKLIDSGANPLGLMGMPNPYSTTSDPKE
jgi:hypothetical protein